MNTRAVLTHLSRRDFLRVASLAGGSALLAAWRTVAPAQLVAHYDGLELD